MKIELHCILAVIHALFILDLRQTGVRYKQDVDSHRVTLDWIMRDALEKGVRYKQDVCAYHHKYFNLHPVRN